MRLHVFVSVVLIISGVVVDLFVFLAHPITAKTLKYQSHTGRMSGPLMIHFKMWSQNYGSYISSHNTLSSCETFPFAQISLTATSSLLSVFLSY